jgi:NAD(P)-dependent dehydrogenase (short-subunit alcohol dehydrogenase family)
MDNNTERQGADLSKRRFTGEVATVTGGASGIGLAIVERLVQEGSRVVIGDVNEEALDRVQQRYGDAIHALVVDVRSEQNLQQMVDEAHSRFGKLSLGFNCAGLGAFGTIIDLTEEDWDTVVDTCLKGVFFAVKHEARAMMETGGGAIVNIASLNCHVPMWGGTAYTAAKAGVEMLGRNAALELAEHKIRVNTVSPGLTDTPLTQGFRDVQGVEQSFMERIPMKRWGSPADMAAAALFLASSDAGYVTGSNLLVDGGWETTAYPNLQPFADAFEEE